MMMIQMVNTAHSGNVESVPPPFMSGAMKKKIVTIGKQLRKMRLMHTWKIEPGFPTPCLQARRPLLVVESMLESTTQMAV